MKLLLHLAILPFTGVMLLSILKSDQALAAPVNNATGRNYAKRRENRTANDIAGAKAVFTGGWNSLQPGAIPLSTAGFAHTAIQKNMWVVFNQVGTASPDCYSEILVQNNNTNTAGATALQAAGYAQGVSPSYKGYVVAVTQYDANTPSLTYGQMVQKSIVHGGNGTSAAQAGGTVEMTYSGAPGLWQAVINGVTAQTQNITCVKKVNGANVTYPAAGGSIVEWGIESNDTTNSFTKDTKLTATRRIGFGVGLYAPPPAASMTVQLYENNVNWTTMYNGSTGEMTFKRP